MNEHTTIDSHKKPKIDGKHLQGDLIEKLHTDRFRDFTDLWAWKSTCSNWSWNFFYQISYIRDKKNLFP